MNAVDTNVLLYVHDPRDPVKQATAKSLVASLTNAALIWQVACEYIAASRKLAPLGFRQEDARLELERLQSLWTCIAPEWSHLRQAEDLISSRSISFWDALIIAVALDSDITTIYSEDLADLGSFPGLQLINPFAP
jgi:predicted nucleic acid-binding protein